MRIGFDFGIMNQQNVQDELLRKMTPEQKLKASMRLYYAAREFKAAWLRHIHNDWSEEQIQAAVREIFANAGN